MKKRLLSLALCLALCLGLFPFGALAADSESGGVYVSPGSPTEGGGGTYIPGEDTRTEIWCVSKPDSIGRSYDGTTDGGTIPIDLTFTDGTNEIKLKEGTGFTAKKTFDSADAGWHTVTVEIALIGEAAVKYKLKAGEETFTIGGNINKAYPDLTVTLSKTACTAGEKLLPLLSVEGAPEDAEVTYYYLASALKSWAGSSDVEGSEAMPKIDENTAISDPGTYYVYAKTGETKNYEEERSTTVELTVSNDVASVTTSDGVITNYTSLDDALDAVKDGDTITLLSDAAVTRWHSLSTAFTLELNGKTATTESNAELYIHAQVIVQDSSTGKTGGMAGTALLNVQEGGDLIIKSGTFNGRITINDGKLTINGGTFNQKVDLPRGDSDSVFFSGGTFAKIWYPNSSGSFLDLLAYGCAFYDNNDQLVNAANSTGRYLYNVKVKEHQHSFTDGACACGYTCPHTSVNESSVCTVCGKQMAASVMVGDTVTHYDTFSNALTYASQNDGCTLKLLANVGDVTVDTDKPFTLDLNGYNIYSLTVNSRITIKDSAENKGKITEKLVVSSLLTIGDLLEEGYAFRGSDGMWPPETSMAVGGVSVQPVPIKSITAANPTLTAEYGKTSEITLTPIIKASSEEGMLSYQWYKIGGSLILVEGATNSTYQLPSDLNAGTYTYRLTVTKDGYQKSCDFNVMVNKSTPTGDPKYTAITTSGKKLSDADLTTAGSTFSVPGHVQWVEEKEGQLVEMDVDTEVKANTAYTWKFMPDDKENYNSLTGTITLWHKSSSSGSSGSVTPGTKTDTVKNPDGSTTKTETKADGSKTETTTASSGGGSTGTTVTKTDAKGNTTTEASAKLSDRDVKEAQEKGEAVTVPVKGIAAAKDANAATKIKIDVPNNANKTTVEIPVENVTSGTVAVIVHEDGTEELVKDSKPTEHGVQLELSGSTMVKIIDNSKTFDDTKDHWSRDEVNFVAARELFQGVGENRFGVSEPMTRGMVNTVLARLAGVDTTPSQGQAWYEVGTDWAKKNGISDGTNPTAPVTREQLATLLYRYAGSPSVSGTLHAADAASVSDYAEDALLWANQNGIVNGVGSNTIAPKDNAQRAQVAAMLARYLQNQ